MSMYFNESYEKDSQIYTFYISYFPQFIYASLCLQLRIFKMKTTLSYSFANVSIKQKV